MITLGSHLRCVPFQVVVDDVNGGGQPPDLITASLYRLMCCSMSLRVDLSRTRTLPRSMLILPVAHEHPSLVSTTLIVAFDAVAPSGPRLNSNLRWRRYCRLQLSFSARCDARIDAGRGRRFGRYRSTVVEFDCCALVNLISIVNDRYEFVRILKMYMHM